MAAEKADEHQVRVDQDRCQQVELQAPVGRKYLR